MGAVTLVLPALLGYREDILRRIDLAGRAEFGARYQGLVPFELSRRTSHPMILRLLERAREKEETHHV